MAYINREKFAEKIAKCSAFNRQGFEFEGNLLQGVVLDLIDAEPTADVVEVIRCRKCTNCEIVIDQFDNDWYFCKRTKDNIEVKSDDYCSCGERKTDNAL